MQLFIISVSLSLSSLHVSAIYGHHQVPLLAKTVSLCSMCNFHKAYIHGAKTMLLTGRVKNTVKGAYMITAPTQLGTTHT
jgi:hypothetical protein